MRVFNRDLKKALRLLAAGKKTQVVRFLEPKVPLFIEDPNFYVILGRAYLESGLLKDADTYLKRGSQADKNSLDIRLLLAVNYLKRKKSAEALKIWLEILEDIPNEPHAKRGLSLLKRATDLDSMYFKRARMYRLLPYIGSRWMPLALRLIIAAAILLPIILYSGRIVDALSDNRTLPDFYENQTLETWIDNNSSIEITTLSDKEVNEIWLKALKHYRSYQDNQARHELNKIKYSDASEKIRNQSIQLIASLRPSSIESLDKNFTYAEVKSKPWLYEGCYVLWRGLTSNIIINENAMNFELLVGLDGGRILEGRVPVAVPFITVIEPLPLELLARVDINGLDFSLNARILHFIRN